MSSPENFPSRFLPLSLLVFHNSFKFLLSSPDRLKTFSQGNTKCWRNRFFLLHTSAVNYYIQDFLPKHQLVNVLVPKNIYRVVLMTIVKLLFVDFTLKTFIYGERMSQHSISFRIQNMNKNSPKLLKYRLMFLDYNLFSCFTNTRDI